MKIICIGRNYSDHISELDNVVPDDIVIFLKPETSIHTSQEWVAPNFSKNIHYECEIALKISTTGKRISENEALDYFEEISLGIDFTARDIQSKLKSKGLPWEKAKSFDSSVILGEFVNKSNFNLDNIEFEFYKNEERVQHGQSSKMIYSFSTIISKCSEYFTLEEGDIILTGTPSGVGKVNPNDEYYGMLENKEVLRFKAL